MTAAVAALDDSDLAESRTRSARQVALQAVLLGVLADQVFRNAQHGLGWPIWIAALAVASLLVVRYGSQRMGREQAAWLGVAILCAASTAWRDADELQFLNTVATLVALAMFSMASAGRPATSVLTARVRDVPTAWFYAARDGAFGTLRLFGEAEVGSAIRSTAVARWPVLRAVLLTIPVFIVFTALLSRADPEFGTIFGLPDVRIDELVSHLFVGGVFAWLSAGWMRGALLNTPGRSALPAQLPFRLGSVEVTAALGVVLGLFVVFVAIQVRWLFGGADVVLATTGLSVAEYARRGFFELVTVSALVFPLILGTRAAIDDPATIQRHTRLSIALLTMLAAIMASATLRMQLYVEYFGLTTDRLYALVFMAWLAVAFIGMGLTLLRGWGRPFAAITAVSAFAALLSLTALNPDTFVARVNLGRNTTHPVDYEYLSRLSSDAASIVAPAIAAATPSPGACSAAKWMRSRALRSDKSQARLGALHARSVVLDQLTPSRIERLCSVS